MDQQDIINRLNFIRDAEALKNVLRNSFTSQGRHESTAEHTWRLCLLAMTFEQLMPGVDLSKVLKMCVVHDLGEAIHGDIPAPQQMPGEDKNQAERRDLCQLLTPLPVALQQEFVGLWDEYVAADSLEAKTVKALDKLETIIQHNQGANPQGFDYRFNLNYGRQYTDAIPLFALIRSLLDADTAANAERYQDT